MGRVCVMITALGRLLRDGDTPHPQEILERARREGRSIGPLARTLEEFFIAEQLAFGLDQPARLAAGRRRRRVAGTPELLRPVNQRYCDYLVRCAERARHAGTHPRADSTIEQAIAVVRDLAIFVTVEGAKNDWATLQTSDIEAFLNTQPANRRRRLLTVRQFVRWARRNKIMLTDPTSTIVVAPRGGFIGPTLTPADQRRLFRRWTDNDVHPHEALVGILALLHALTNTELRLLRVDGIDPRRQTLHVEGRPHAVPLDPRSLNAIQNCIAHRAHLQTHNPYLIVTRSTKTRATPASAPYLTHVLDAAGVCPTTLRSTRLLDLVITLDPKLVAETLGMNADGLLHYLADNVDRDRLPKATNL